MEDQEGQQNNMISNLPLLFANGYPTSLDKITESQLENFVPFMVQCSLGHINLQGKIDYSEPEWWPENLQFSIPFTKPKKFVGNWIDKMKEVVIICYQFHKSVFLLRFCNDLAAYEHASLRFINNYNSTTSLFDRRSNKLLVTFRNENMSYDQPQKSRKSLLQNKSKSGHRMLDHDDHKMMVEPAPFDIYLCDNCDAELYSKQAILEHEKTCVLDVDDVILCDTPEPLDENQSNTQKNNENSELRIGFLLNFSLQCRENVRNTISNEDPGNFHEKCMDLRSGMSSKDENNYIYLEKNKRISRRNRAYQSLARCPTIPLSSPAGQLLVRTTKTYMSREYLNERLDRVERFCHAPILSRSSVKPKYLGKKYAPNNIHCTYKKLSEQSNHMYVFPRRQFSQKRRTENFMFFNSPLIKKCRPISVRLKKITENEIKLKRKSPNAKLNIKLTRDTSRSSNWKISSSPSSEIIVDTINLCSSDDELEDAERTKKHTVEAQVNFNDNSLSFQKSVTTLTPLSLSCGSNVVKSKLKKIKKRFNTSEATLTPTYKSTSSYQMKCDKMSKSSSAIKNVTTVFQTTKEENNGSWCDGNIRCLNSIASSENGMTHLKPLQPSAFIFSNYVTNPIAVASSNNNEIMTQRNPVLPESVDFKTQNQENHLKNTEFSSGNDSKRTSGTTMTSNTPSSDWLPHVSNLAPCSNVRNIIGNSSLSQSRIVDRDRTSKSLPLMQSFGSPSRVISIDLTT